MVRFFLIFLAIQGVLFTAELTRPIQEAFVIPFTESIAAVAAWIIQLIDPETVSKGVVIWDQQSGFAIAIEAGCNGVEATIVLIAAMVAFPSSWRMKLLGIAVGFITIQVINMLRLVTLYFLGQWNETAFQWAHLYLWQALVMLDVLIVFVLWLRYLPRTGREAHAI